MKPSVWPHKKLCVCVCVRDFSLEHQCHAGLEQSALDEISGVVQPAGQIAHEMTLSHKFLHDIWVPWTCHFPHLMELMKPL